MLKKLQKDNKGFTIIEVMIVLAIAGLILLIVFLAVPALQRNQRNTQRKNDASHVAGLISEYQSNNNGALPTKVDFSGTVGTNELDATKEKFSILDTTTGTTVAPATLPTPAPTTVTTDFVAIYTKATCSGNLAAAASSARSAVVLYNLEGATATGCIQI